MAQTFLNTRIFQLLIMIAITVSLLGIVSSIYTINHIKEYDELKNVRQLSIVIAWICTVAILTIIVILYMNLNKNKPLASHIEVGSAQDLI
jgi:multisubunit Na+/H+ antiporter MnhB subunit